MGTSADVAGELVDQLVELLRPFPDDHVVDLLRPLLDSREITPLVEYIGRDRLGQGEGLRQMHFELEGGALRKTRLPHGPIGKAELEHLARRRASPEACGPFSGCSASRA